MHAATGPGPWADHLRLALRDRLADELVTRDLWLTAPSSSLAHTYAAALPGLRRVPWFPRLLPSMQWLPVLGYKMHRPAGPLTPEPNADNTADAGSV